MVLSRIREFAAAVLVASAAGCAGPALDLQPWRAEQQAAVSAELRGTGALASELPRVARLRDERRLAEARQLALTLAAEHPEDPAALVAASRAESDAVFLFAEDDKRARNHAAASALDYALAAERHGAASAQDRAQLAWALGTSTHLQPMFERAGHARSTLAAARSALALDPDEPTALATLALVNLRLATLPWIAKAMAWTAPDASLADAERFARRAVERLPSRENRRILAQVLSAAEREGEARAELDLALAAPAAHPRDLALAPALASLRRSLD